MSVSVHPTAVVSPEAELADGVSVGPYSVIGGKVTIGRGTKIGAYVRVFDGVSIGEDCKVFENAIIGGDPQDHDYKGEVSWARIGHKVIIREFVTINRASGEGNETVVGDGTLLMEGVHVAHNAVVGKNVTVANKTGLAGYINLGDYSTIGGLTGLHQFVSVGKYSMIGGASKVVKDVPPYTLADGHPAKMYGLNVVGLRRAGFSQKDRQEIKKIYHILYRSGLGAKEALKAIEKEFQDNLLAKEVLEFMTSSRRGLTPWCR